MKHGDNTSRYVQVPVPEDLVPKVIKLLAEWDESKGEPEASGAMRQESSPRIYLDANLVARMYLESEERHRLLLNFMANHAGTWLFTSDLENALGITTGSKSMAGTFGAFGRRSKHRYEGLKPWQTEWDHQHQEVRYRMEPEVAEWILAANGDA
jgi:hypothetical protein